MSKIQSKKIKEEEAKALGYNLEDLQKRKSGKASKV